MEAILRGCQGYSPISGPGVLWAPVESSRFAPHFRGFLAQTRKTKRAKICLKRLALSLTPEKWP